MLMSRRSPFLARTQLSQAAMTVAASKRWSAVVCLGCLIRGETSHFEFIAHAAAGGITRAAQITGVPITFGVLTTNTAEEALARAGDGPANKGREAAMAAVEMARAGREAVAVMNARHAARDAALQVLTFARSAVHGPARRSRRFSPSMRQRPMRRSARSRATS